MLTGVQPTITISEALEAEGAFASCGCGDASAPRIVEPSEVSAGAREVMGGLMENASEKRMSVEAALVHAWMTTEGGAATGMVERA